MVSKRLPANTGGGNLLTTQGDASPGHSDNHLVLLQETEGDDWQRGTECTKSHLSKQSKPSFLRDDHEERNMLDLPPPPRDDGNSLSASTPSINGEVEPDDTSLVMHNNNSSAWRTRNAAESMAKLGASTDTGASARTSPAAIFDKPEGKQIKIVSDC